MAEVCNPVLLRFISAPVEGEGRRNWLLAVRNEGKYLDEKQLLTDKDSPAQSKVKTTENRV